MHINMAHGYEVLVVLITVVIDALAGGLPGRHRGAPDLSGTLFVFDLVVVLASFVRQIDSFDVAPNEQVAEEVSWTENIQGTSNMVTCGSPV